MFGLCVFVFKEFLANWNLSKVCHRSWPGGGWGGGSEVVVHHLVPGRGRGTPTGSQLGREYPILALAGREGRGYPILVLAEWEGDFPSPGQGEGTPFLRSEWCAPWKEPGTRDQGPVIWVPPPLPIVDRQPGPDISTDGL